VFPIRIARSSLRNDVGTISTGEFPSSPAQFWEDFTTNTVSSFAPPKYRDFCGPQVEPIETTNEFARIKF